MTGQFQLWFDEISRRLKVANQVESLTEAFMKCSTDEIRVKFVLQQCSVHDVIKLKTSFKSKSKELSIEYRTKGNTLFQKKKYEDALVSYSMSVLLAPMWMKEGLCEAEAEPEGGVELSLAFANRSAVLYYMDNNDESLQDIQMSLKNGYPDELRYKLFDRMGKCFTRLGQIIEAKEAFGTAVGFLTKCKLTTDKKNMWARDLYKSIKNCSNISINGANSSKNVNELCPVIHDGDRSPSFSCASAMFDVTYKPSMGRYGVATRYIKAGEVILVEKPYADVLLPEFYSTHCYNCLMQSVALVPCRQCSQVGFCSESCEQEAWQDFHYVECKYLDLINDANVGLGHLALRMILKAGFQLLLNIKDKTHLVWTDDDQLTLGKNLNGVYDSLDYWACYCLIGHSEDRSAGDLFRRTVMAVFLLKILQDSDFFLSNINKEDIVNENCFAYVGGHLLKQIQMLPCNAHEVSELWVNKSVIANSELKEVGSAIYATLSLLNHSCNPSVVRHCYGNHCVLRAIKDIPEGGEIIDNYGSLYAVTPLQERHDLLKGQYYFECQCIACKENWPLYGDMEDANPKIKCENCENVVKIISQNDKILCICSYCNTKIDCSQEFDEFQKSRKDFAILMDAVLQDNIIESNLDTALKYLHLMSKWVILPWHEFNKCQELVKHCFSMMGNHFPG